MAPWRPGWTVRHSLVVAGVAVPAVAAYWSLSAVPGTGWRTLVAVLLGAAAGVVAASYLPAHSAEGHGLAPVGGPCAAAPVMMLVGAGLMVGEGATFAPLSLVLAGVAVLQRTTGASTCSVVSDSR